ncbi:uncharacterized protein RHOBADRAFT_56626 [Rhodotorula graminis WP1]|uniref:Uncharacterized protein n=1 Tax=Rhodotorula graminis (strain WP1) TaxID=578459 RepID=A0A0P9EDK5_RHOGW|nr:uncharacterized protein RHOBADRAFT_56626 [Rhodotorula graminis WP1]KPV71434.1 hypothetical protein RHOBADRAFT_56626 [Rhodotorula graminis WP1]
MPTLELEAWPPVGATYAHWPDLLLATQLSALRRGYGHIVPAWGGAQSKSLKITIGCRPTWDQQPRRELALVAVQRGTQDLGGAWTVTEAPVEKYSEPTASRFQTPQLEKVQAGDVFTTANELDSLEGALRATARQDGRFLVSEVGRKTLPHGETTRTLALACVLQPSQCAFHVLFRELENRHWQCVKVEGAHSCTPTATSTAPQDLVSRMKLFATIELQDGLQDSVFGTRPRARPLSVVEKQLGAFPVEPLLAP